MDWRKIGVAIAAIAAIAIAYTAIAAPLGWGGYGMPMGMMGLPMMHGYMPVYDYPQNLQNINETPKYPQSYYVPYGYYRGWHCPMMGYW